MSDIIASIRVALGLDDAQFSSGAKRAQKSIIGLEKTITSTSRTIKGFAAALTVGMFAHAISEALEYAGSLAETAQQLGVTARQLQIYRFAAGQVGVSQEQLEIGLKKLNTSLGQAKLGAEAPKKAFEALSKLIGKDIVASSKQGGDALPLVADALSKVADRSKRAAAEVAIMGKSGSALDNLLSGGSRALNELAEAADKLGIVLSDQQIQDADATADKLRAVKTVLEAQIAGVVAQNAGAILSLASALGQLTSQIVKFLSSNPSLALGIIGGLLGGRVGGLPGAVLGGAAGALLGGRAANNMADANNDKAFRRKEFIKAEVAYQRALRGGNAPGPAMSVGGIQVGGGAGAGAPISALKAERDRQERLFRASVIAANRKPAVSGGGGPDIGNFLAGAGPKAKKAKEDHTGEQQLREAKQFADDMRRAQIDTLQAKQNLAKSADEQADFELQILDKQKEQYNADLDYEVALNKLTKGVQGMTAEQANQLRAQYDQTDALKRQAIADEQIAQKKRDAVELADNRADLQIEQLQLEADLATNSKARRDAEMRILEAMKAQERARLEAVLADEKSTDLAKKEAQARLSKLDELYGLKAQGVAQQTAGPLEQWANSVRDTTDAMQQLKVDGINGAVDSIMALTEGFSSFRDTALSAIKSVIAELLRMQLMKLALNIFGAASGGGGFSSAGLVSGNMSALGALASGGAALGSSGGGSLPGFASGGRGVFGGMPGVDRNILSMNGLPIAKVSRGEPWAFGPHAMAGGGVSIVQHFSGNVTRETMGQVAAKTQSAIASAKRRGY
jgi:hypothetical protein